MEYPNQFLLYETMLAKLGSRTVLIPKPRQLHLGHGPLGFYHDRPIQLTLAVRGGPRGEVRCVPLSQACGSWPSGADPFFEEIRQEIGLTYVAYHCHSPAMPFDVTFTLSAPWYPGDTMLSTAPFFYLTASVVSRDSRRVDGSVLLAAENPFVCDDGHQGRKAESRFYETADLLGFTFEDGSLVDARELFAASRSGLTFAVEDYRGELYSDFAQQGRLSDHVNKRPAHRHASGLAWEFALAPGQEARKAFVWAAYVPGPVLTWEQTPAPFLYTRFFADVEEVVDYAFRVEREAQQKVELLESTVRDSSLSEPLRQLLPFAAQSYIANTWWMEADPPVFTVWEGCCRFHSTVDLAYHCEVFNLLYWPELLRTQLEQWTRFQIGDYLAHDIGDEHKITGPAYTGDMPAEENANWLLLTYAYWKFTGDDSPIRRHAELIERLVRYIWLSDLDADGLPDEPTAVVNTFDDATPLVGSSAGQTYLGIKCMAASMAVRAMAYVLANEELEKACSVEIARAAKTLRSRSWVGDHFAICLDERIGGREGYTALASQGLPYLLATGEEVDLPLDLVAQDIEAHVPKLMRRFGTVHSDSDYNIWFSANIWRDLVGLYLDLPLEEQARRYWDFQLMRNVFDTGAYTDCYRTARHRFDLDRYPRGAAAFGYFLALPRMTVDRPRGRFSFAPLSARFRWPLIPLADWRRLRLPWISLEANGNQAVFRMTEFGRVASFTEIRGRLRFESEPRSMTVEGEVDVDWVGSPRRLESGLWELELSFRPKAKEIEITTVTVTFRLAAEG